MKIVKPFAIVLTGLCLTANFAHAGDTIKSYTSTLYQLDDSDARAKRIRLIYTVQNAWNQSHYPEGIKEVKLVLNGGSGFDMTNIPSRQTLYEYGTSADYRYTVPTAFQLKVGYQDGAILRHLSHAPANTIASAQVSESTDFNLGVTLNEESPSITGGVSWSTRITYNQEEFKTITDFDQSNEGITWDIVNQTIKHRTPPKDNLLYAWTYLFWGCSINNLIPTSELPTVMTSDFKPEAAVLYRKRDLNDGVNYSRLKLEANWQKTHYHFARDWCSFYSNFSWKGYSDYSEWTKASRIVTVSWNDSLYH
ncbi:dTDP-glucose 4,6-dehydratase [Hahella sp. CCB-MM4]|uniref:leukocidin family pore-forming toxin n=1 Tax=Hahella sp. (strain CCB-MM4) TaxID=1926491 RepID=UPI000B9C2260|nr:leukocidin family pore-forming toxin [Hahella sp. CCB-MM4]OZG71493.1 dTDP-glucose 4,6-dehydratase [Hahella sp. CCB-MM4]